MNEVDPARSKQMGRVRGRDTKPEMLVRRALHAAGLRFRLHVKDLPGKPDVVLPPRRLAIFVHGCFWHRHDDPDCKLARLPKSRLDFWLPKLEANRQRDRRNEQHLRDGEWIVKSIWECQLKDPDKLRQFVDECCGIKPKPRPQARLKRSRRPKRAAPPVLRRQTSAKSDA